MRHSEIDKRAKRNAPRQCLSDYGHNVHKDAPVRTIDLVLPFSLEPLAQWISQNVRSRQQVALMREEGY